MMATRRSMGLGGEREVDDEQRFLGDAEGGGFQQGGGRTDEFGNAVPDFANDPNYPTPFQDYDPTEIAGNTERGVDIGGPSGMPTTSRPAQTPTGPPPMALPKGVSVNDNMFTANDGMFSGVPDYGNSMETPAMPTTPTMANGQASNAAPESGTNSGPMRRSASSPSIYGESSNPTMFGRADGLLGGGKSLAGQEESSGPLAPTDMMQKLLQLFRMRGGAQ